MTEPYVHTSGDGPPAVLVHGTFVGGPQSFAAQAPLAENHRLLIVDRRGYGANPAQGETLGWPVDSEDLLRLLEELGGAHLVGHSYGGAVVAVAAMLQRERGVFERAPAMSAGDWSRLWLTRVAGMPDEGADGWMGTWGEQEWAMAEVVRREAWAGAAPVDADVLAAARFPKLLVVGSKAPPTATASVRAVGRALVEALVRRIGVEVVVFEGSGHLPPVEEPERFNDLLRRAWAVPGSGGKW